MLYRTLVRPLLYRLSAERAHHLIVALLTFVAWLPLGLRLLRFCLRPQRTRPVSALGLEFPNPIGLAAGFDKDGRVFDALAALGFGFIEIGTVTHHPQPGNPLPRLFRLPRDHALLNRMGFNNLGAAAMAARLRLRGSKSRPLLGINLGKTKLTLAEDAPKDYEGSATLLAPYADYLVVNVSSPNTPGLRDLQSVEALRPILEHVRGAAERAVQDRRVPLLVKIAPDLSNDDVIAVADLALEMGLDGIIATNTTISRDGLMTPADEVQALGAGGISGRPVKARSLEVLKLLRHRVGTRLTIISVGGIETGAEAQERLDHGATLVQIYSSLVYEGPTLVRKMVNALEAPHNRSGASVAD